MIDDFQVNLPLTAEIRRDSFLWRRRAEDGFRFSSVDFESPFGVPSLKRAEMVSKWNYYTWDESIPMVECNVVRLGSGCDSWLAGNVWRGKIEKDRRNWKTLYNFGRDRSKTGELLTNSDLTCCRPCSRQHEKDDDRNSVSFGSSVEHKRGYF